MPTYTFNLSEIRRLFEKSEYVNCLIKSKEFLSMILSAFLDSAYMYLNQTKKMPSNRQENIFARLINESYKLGLITEEEKQDLDKIRNIRNDTHDLFFDKKIEQGEVKKENILEVVEITERLFIVLKDRRDNFNKQHVEELVQAEDINVVFQKRTPQTLRNLIKNN